jgi:glycosyltransferase involved in cell wall biosynthesis
VKVLFITEHRYLPQYLGGMQTTADNLCHALLERGHEVAILASCMRKGVFGWRSSIQRKILRRSVLRDMKCGYPVWRSWLPSNEVDYVAQKESPDVIVVMAMAPVRMALAARPTNIPIVMQLHDVEFDCHGGNFEELGDITCVANSQFTAEKYRRAFGVDPMVIYPFILASKYKTTPTRDNVTFINPIPVKGRDIVLNIARLCPEIPFVFVESWPLRAEQRHELMNRLSTYRNITLLKPHLNMKKVYQRCKILLAPSVWEEAYGRVATEAQISGIPVVASARGGLPEAVGPGGVLVDPDGPIDSWVTAIRRLWHDEQYYAQLSAEAFAHATRRDISFDHQIEAWEEILSRAANRVC